jgi:hypothetical protein
MGISDLPLAVVDWVADLLADLLAAALAVGAAVDLCVAVTGSLAGLPAQPGCQPLACAQALRGRGTQHGVPAPPEIPQGLPTQAFGLSVGVGPTLFEAAVDEQKAVHRMALVLQKAQLYGGY